MATQGIVSIRRNGKMIAKVVAGCDGMNAQKMAEVVAGCDGMNAQKMANCLELALKTIRASEKAFNAIRRDA